MLCIPVFQSRQIRMREIAVEVVPQARHMAQVSGLAIAFGKARPAPLEGRSIACDRHSSFPSRATAFTLLLRNLDVDENGLRKLPFFPLPSLPDSHK